jgi:serine/threonine protein kinase
VDFGLARPIASRLTAEGSLVGSLHYIAPEQALGQPVDARTDLYSLGVILYELVAGRLPFTAEDPLALVAQHIYAPVVPPRAFRDDCRPFQRRSCSSSPNWCRPSISADDVESAWQLSPRCSPLNQAAMGGLATDRIAEAGGRPAGGLGSPPRCGVRRRRHFKVLW